MFQRPLPNPFVLHIPPGEVLAVAPRGRRPAALVGIPDELNRALGSFIVAGAYRLRRGHVNKPMTMLVHTSQSQVAHRRLWSLLDDAVRSLRNRVEDTYERGSVLTWLRTIWEADFGPTSERLASEYRNAVHPFAELEEYALEFLKELQAI